MHIYIPHKYEINHFRNGTLLQRSFYWCDSLGGRGVYSCEPLDIISIIIRVRRTLMILTALQGIVYDQGGQTHASPITTHHKASLRLHDQQGGHTHASPITTKEAYMCLNG